jgi:hypothetical protein
MKIASPFKGLQLTEELVCEFFAVFSRFEFTLKESGFIRKNRRPVEPAWRSFGADASNYLTVNAGTDLAEAINYLTSEIPQVQVEIDKWEPTPLHGVSDVDRAFDAIARVRNNLFHGGKHTPHSPPGRDKKLIQASLCVLYGCLEQNEGFRNIYEQNVF